MPGPVVHDEPRSVTQPFQVLWFECVQTPAVQTPNVHTPAVQVASPQTPAVCVVHVPAVCAVHVPRFHEPECDAQVPEVVQVAV